MIAISNAVGVVKGKDAYKKVEKEPTESEARMEIPGINEEVKIPVLTKHSPRRSNF